ncbi:redoxin domain-containing protein [Candidatus Poriferisodalis sp.]|uniref:redoxin domain-containing protein n=1 Tax=Candidatus Poriferisodalis sp. TaxID=3101277 RepID=UPI003B023B75
MKSSFARYLALGVLVVGAALIVWAAVNDPDPEPVFTETASAAVEAPTTTSASDAPAALTTTTTGPPEPIPVLGTALTLSKLDGWLNTDATSLEEIRASNKITVVQFWTFGCRNCKNTLDALGQLYDDFRDEGVEIVGVHSPEFAYEADVDNIIEAAADLGVVWPIALDTTKRNFHDWQEGPTGYWPRVYVIDSDNQIRFERRGDSPSKYRELYEIVERLLTET